jgi:hypothetical protein
MNNAAAAENSANMAATLDPGEPEALRIGIWACREHCAGSTTAALVRRAPAGPGAGRPEAVAARALSRVLLGEAAAVLSELTPRLNGERTPPDILLALGCAQFALGRPRQAADLFVQVLRHREGDTLAQRLVGWAYELVNNPTTDALDASCACASADPDVQSAACGHGPGHRTGVRPSRRVGGPVGP